MNAAEALADMTSITQADLLLSGFPSSLRWTIGEDSSSYFSLPPIGRIASSDRIVLSDTQAGEIRAYSAAGIPVWVAGGRGRGPGEFNRLDWIGLDGHGHGHVLGWEASAARLASFEVTSGALAQSTTVSPQHFAQRRLSPFAVTEDAIYFSPVPGIGALRLAWPSEQEVWRPSQPIVVAALRGAQIDTALTVPGDEMYLFDEVASRVAIRPINGARSFIVHLDDAVFLGDSKSGVLAAFSEDGGIRRYQLLPAIVGSLCTDERLKAQRAQMLEQVADAPEIFRRAWASSPTNPLQTVIDGLSATSDGHLLVRLKIADATYASLLTVDGEFVDALEIEWSSHVLDWAHGLVLTSTVDELGRAEVSLWNR